MTKSINVKISEKALHVLNLVKAIKNFSSQDQALEYILLNFNGEKVETGSAGHQ